MSQADFAYAFQLSPNQIKGWDQGRSRPLGGLRAYLLISDHDPKQVLELLRTAPKRKAA